MHNYKILLPAVYLIIIAFGCKTKAPQISDNQATDKQDIQQKKQYWQDSLRQVIHIPADSIASSDESVADSNIVQLQMHTVQKPYEKDTITFIGVGDIMLGTNFPNESYLPPNEGKDMLTDVIGVLQSVDITFGNQEGVILNEGGQQKNCSNPAVCYLFRSPEYMAQRLQEAGFDVMSLANNHAGDFGDAGRKNTMRVFDSLGIHHAGQEARPFTVFRFDSLTIGFAAFSPNVGTVKINDYSRAKAIIHHLDSISDIVMVSFHGGAEGAKYTNVTRQREYFVGEDRGNVYEFAHLVIDAGADIVFGHGPHVPRAVEIYKNRFIAYSLGNFATYGRFNLRGDNGLAPIVKIYTNRKGEFLYGKIISAKQVDGGVPKLDYEHHAAMRIKQLTEQDFPESKILIDEVGNINYIQSEY